ncbi:MULTISPECIES: Gfo/Idh/MocA family oxidoreductase [Devosia]|uniref:Putative oxidoreductase YcjS n=1 Tax=Devosia equisanguinis TaxID=2490941 RepID=A0A3S4CTS8_9HYPH|nr:MULTISPECIES: Gfo/Idh/MocA family oxidoreductase [Devosia]ODT49706.1 MAG: oxidoreductase [Pelagibacterium sp. SCN 63-126]ODU87717.1 MAG: oxidoreductase [Pelagibacterium sp. SCN 63-17]OJX45719.1 MAG: oxidoreductase [Devosia sp. 63-57]VDS05675.1 putative oxidoreductase YcjS [Devosia equisanguinis]
MRILILGTGGMANQHAKHFAAIEGVTLAGGVDVDPARVEAFNQTHGIERGFGSLDAALAWGEFDAVANVTPDSIHHPTTMAALNAGKHVFCEKPLATDHAKAMEMTETAERLGLVNMVNLTYRNVAQLQKAREIVQSGAVGTVKHFEASYLQSWLVSKAWGDWRTESQWLWRLSKKHGSNGVLGDIGVHILDFAAYGAGSDFSRVFCRLETFDKAPGNQIGEYDLDANDSFAMTAQLENGALGVVHASRWATGHFNELRLRVYGEKGSIEIQHRHDWSKLLTCLGDDVETGTWSEVEVGPVPTNYQRFAEAVRLGKNLEPSFRHATNIQKVLDLATVTDRDRTEHRV